MTAFLALLRRDLLLARRNGSALGTALGFYVIVVTLLPLGLGPDLNLLTRIGPGILWIALLLAALLSLGRMFEIDDADGTLDGLAGGPLPLELVATAKGLAHWIAVALPLTAITPVLGLMLNLDAAAYVPLLATLLLGTPAVSFIGLIGAALTLRTRRGGLLLALTVLPLYIPTLIFGISAIQASLTASSGGTGASLAILAAISLGSLVLGPLAAAAALRLQIGS
jgi:heme exporter protein B